MKLVQSSFPIGLAALATVLLSACSVSTDPDASAQQGAPVVPEPVLGRVSWDDHPERPVHRVSCQFEAPFYRFRAKGHGFELAVGFWGDDAEMIQQVDFQQADSIELTETTAEGVIYRYTTLRILPEMGEITGSAAKAEGSTRLRPTSLAALTEYGDGVQLDFALDCPITEPARSAES